MKKLNNITYKIETEELRKLAIDYFKEKLGSKVNDKILTQMKFEGFQDVDSNEVNLLKASVTVFVEEKV